MYRLEKGQELTANKLAEFIDKAQQENAVRYSKLEGAYESDYEIFHLPKKPDYKPDNRVAVNFAKYITDTFNGFFAGNAIKTTCDDKKVAEQIEFIEKYNNQDDKNAELAKIMSIYGQGYEYYYTDEAGQLCITYLRPTQAFMVYDDSLVPTPMYIVLFYFDSNNELVGSVSDRMYTWDFKREAGASFVFSEKRNHFFDGVPASEFVENEERRGIFEPVLTLMDTYNKSISEKANDVDYFADAYLCVLGAYLDQEQLDTLRDSRIITLEGPGDNTNLTVKFLEKPNADATQENLLNKLERLIYQIAMVPNINDENFGTSSGIAMQYKVLNTSNLFKVKQRKFEAGLNRRWRLLFSHPLLYGKVKADDWTKLRYRFTPNVPANVLDEAQTASTLSGIVSRQTQLEVLSIVDNVNEELERIKEEEGHPELNDDFNAHEHPEGADHELLEETRSGLA